MTVISPDPLDPITVEQWAELERRYPDATRIGTAFRLAPTIEVCEAFLRNESVPLDRLDPDWVRRLGLKPAA